MGRTTRPSFKQLPDRSRRTLLGAEAERARDRDRCGRDKVGKSSEPGAHETSLVKPTSETHKCKVLCCLCKPISRRAVGSEMKRSVLCLMDQPKQARRLGAKPQNF